MFHSSFHNSGNCFEVDYHQQLSEKFSNASDLLCPIEQPPIASSLNFAVTIRFRYQGAESLLLLAGDRLPHSLFGRILSSTSTAEDFCSALVYRQRALAITLS